MPSIIYSPKIQANPGYEIFTTFTEVDSASDITVTASKVSWDTMTCTATSYVYKDYGAAHFGDFEQLLTINCSSADISGWVIFWNMANQAAQTYDDMANAGSGFTLTLHDNDDNGVYHLRIRDGANPDYLTQHTVTIPFTYYVTISRAGTTWTCDVYSDAARTTLAFTLTRTGATTAFRYLAVACSKSITGTATTTGYSENLDLQEGASAPTVVTNATTSVEETTATLSGNVTSTGGENVTRGFEWDTDLTLPLSTNWSEGTYGIGAYTHPLTGLNKGDKYAVRATANNTAGTDYGNIVYMMTKPDGASSFVSTDNGTDWISLSWTPGAGMDSEEIHWSIVGYPSDNTSGTHGWSGNGSSANVSGLPSDTLIYFSLFTYATEDGTWVQSDFTAMVSDITDWEPLTIPTVIAHDATDIGDTYATLNGEITNSGGENCMMVFFQYGLDPEEFSDNVTDSGNFGIGVFDLYVDDLIPGELYYFRAGAVNSEGIGYSDNGTFIGNHAPVLDAIGNKAVNENVLLQFTANATDPDLDPLTWSISGNPFGSSIDEDTGLFSWHPNYVNAGVYAGIMISVSDGSLSDNETFTITVNNVNRAPVLATIGNKSVTENATLQFTISATDPDSDPLIYSASNLPDGATFNGTTRHFLWIPTDNQSGVYTLVHFVATDNGTLSDYENIRITVNGPLYHSQFPGTTAILGIIPLLVLTGFIVVFVKSTITNVRQNGASYLVTSEGVVDLIMILILSGAFFVIFRIMTSAITSLLE